MVLSGEAARSQSGHSVIHGNVRCPITSGNANKTMTCARLRQNSDHHIYSDDGCKPRRIRRLRASVMGAGCQQRPIAISQHWRTVLNGMKIYFETFRSGSGTVLSALRQL
jgi:hypothetical protein